MELRPRQNEAINAVVTNYLEGIYQQLIVMATGTGKTVIFGNLWKHLVQYLPGRMLVLAHREELIDQAQRTLQLNNPNIKVGKEMAEYRADLDCKIIVSCVASVGRMDSKRLERFGLDTFDKVICDEAHHSIATTYMNVFDALGMLKADSKKLLVGFTATPKRKNLTRSQKKQVTTLDDESLLSLKSVYKKIVFSYPIRQAIKEGWLVPLRGFKVKTESNLDNVRMVAGDYKQDELAATVNVDARNLQVIKAYKEFGEGRQAVGFTVDIAHAQALAKLSRAYDIKAEAVWGNDPDRALKLQQHREKFITILYNAQVLTEGYDDWRVSCIIQTAPTKSSTKYTQTIGRGTRLQEGTGNLLDALKAGMVLEKKDCLIIDLVDNSKRCSLVTFPSLLGLNPEMDLHGESGTHAIEILEGLQEKYPSVDFTQLTDLNDVKQYVESIDLFAAPYTEEVKEFSQLSWMSAQDGSYILSIPERKELSDSKSYARFLHEKLHITQNELDEFELSITTTQSDKKLGVFSNLKEAFETADDVIHRCRADRVRLMQRESPWHESRASEPQKRYLRKLSKKKALLWCLCENKWQPKGSTCPECKLQTGISSGQASLAINILQTK